HHDYRAVRRIYFKFERGDVHHRVAVVHRLPIRDDPPGDAGSDDQALALEPFRVASGCVRGFDLDRVWPPEIQHAGGVVDHVAKPRREDGKHIAKVERGADRLRDLVEGDDLSMCVSNLFERLAALRLWFGGAFETGLLRHRFDLFALRGDFSLEL